MPKWTQDQNAAIVSRGSNLLVSAAAGSGKTAVLVERIIQLIIEDETDIDRLLIVTFTNAAAGEMRERIMNALTKRVAEEEDTEKSMFLRRQIGLIHRAHIMTVHAFCINVVRHYFYEVDIDPAFRIGDTSELGLMLENALNTVMESAYETESEAFYALVESYASNRSDEALKELILKLYFFIQSQPEPLKWLKKQSALYTQAHMDIENSVWMKAYLDMLSQELDRGLDVIEDGMRVCDLPEGPEPYKETFASDRQLVCELKSACESGFETLFSQLESLKFSRLKTIKKAEKDRYAPELIAEAKSIRDILKKKVVDPIKEEILKKTLSRHVEELQALAPMMDAMYTLIEAFHQAYQLDKREKNLLDFNDLEHFAIQVLQNEDIAKVYREQFDYIFLDEYQDSNIVQETIISHIKGEDNLFLVGDVKQSIYRFRLADPTLFLEKYRTYEKGEGAKSRRIDLSQNFRSRPELLEGINYIFERLMSEDFGEMGYDDDAKLYPGLEFPDTSEPLELLVVDSGANEGLQDQELIEMKKAELEAHAVAKRVKALLDKPIYDPKSKQVRMAKFKDIVILLRATKSWAHVFGDIFAHYKIPLYSDVGNSYFDALEIEIFMALIKLIDNHQQDLPLLTVLRSSIGSFSVDELIQIRLINSQVPFYKNFYGLGQDDTALGLKVKSFTDKLKRWSQAERIWPLDEFLWQVMTTSGFYHYVGAMPGGISRQANLRLLIDKAGQFESLGSGGLFEFIAFFEKIKTSGGDIGTAATIGESEDVVRLMSIHKSKGLEFPVVILAGAGKKFNLRDTYDKMLMHKDFGIGLRYTDPMKRFYSVSLPQMIMKRQLKMESLAEEMRILYVAMTRAVDKLIIIGSTGRLESDLAKWMRGPSVHNLQGGRSYMDWVATIMSRHPSGEALRDLSELPVFPQPCSMKNRWAVQVYRKDVLLDSNFALDFEDENQYFMTPKTDLSAAPVSEEKEAINYQAEINRRLSWEYPSQATVNMPFLLSVSDMKRAQSVDVTKANVHIPPLIEKPKFLEQVTKKSAAEIGTLHHLIMQHLDFAGDLSIEGIEKQVKQMVLKNYLEHDDRTLIHYDQIAQFFNLDLGQRMLSSKNVYREVPFVYNKVVEGSDILVQGIIDCYFEEEDGLVLVDYKTDFTGLQGVKAAAESYQVQVDLYAQALEQLLKKTVKAAYVHFFDVGESVQML